VEEANRPHRPLVGQLELRLDEAIVGQLLVPCRRHVVVLPLTVVFETAGGGARGQPVVEGVSLGEAAAGRVAVEQLELGV